MIQTFGATRKHSMSLEGRLGWTYKRPSYQPTGTQPSLRFVSEWRSANRSTSLSSISRPTLCTPWSLTGNTAPPHWVVTRGRHWLVHRPPCSATVTRKGSMLKFQVAVLKQESVWLRTTKMTATAAIPGSGLVQEGLLIIPTRAETRLNGHQIMVT